MDPAGRRMFGVAAGFVSVAGFVWLALSVLLALIGDARGQLASEVLRVGGPPGVVAVVAGLLSLWARR